MWRETYKRPYFFYISSIQCSSIHGDSWHKKSIPVLTGIKWFEKITFDSRRALAPSHFLLVIFFRLLIMSITYHSCIAYVGHYLHVFAVFSTETNKKWTRSICLKGHRRLIFFCILYLDFEAGYRISYARFLIILIFRLKYSLESVNRW